MLLGIIINDSLIFDLIVIKLGVFEVLIALKLELFFNELFSSLIILLYSSYAIPPNLKNL